MAEDYPLFDYRPGKAPLLIAAPHVGTYIPADIAERLNDIGRTVNETDFHVHRLYDFAQDMGAATLWATHSRYVVDLNRDPDSLSLYPGLFETPMCPTCDFDQVAIYQDGQEPDDAEIARRRALYWQPYHQRLAQTLDEMVARHGYALLIDAHSIRPSIPSLFEGSLPDLSFGFNDGRASAAAFIETVRDWAQSQSRWSHVIDGRFKGGYTTRLYGQPQQHIHALQIEIVQDTYLNMATPYLYDADIAAEISLSLSGLVDALLKTQSGES